MLHVNYYMNILLNVVQKWLVIGQSVKWDMEQYTNLVTSLRSESGTLSLTSMPMWKFWCGVSSLVFAWWNSITWDLQRFNHVASGSFEWNLKNTPRCLDIVVFSFLQSWTTQCFLVGSHWIERLVITLDLQRQCKPPAKRKQKKQVSWWFIT